MTKEEDRLLQEINSTGGIHPTPQNKDTLEYLTEKGLLQKEDDGDKVEYKLTRYGEIIYVVGFKSFEQTEKFERKISQTTPFEVNLIKIVLIVLCLLLIILLTSITILPT